MSQQKYTLKQLRGAWAAGKNSAEVEKDPHVGLWFHSTCEDGSANWQGQIIGGSFEEGYQCQLFSWLTGLPTEVKVIPILKMENWHFYPSSGAMNVAYVNSGGRKL